MRVSLFKLIYMIHTLYVESDPTVKIRLKREDNYLFLWADYEDDPTVETIEFSMSKVELHEFIGVLLHLQSQIKKSQ